MVTRTCRCGAKFQARQADVARGWAKSCSKSCAAKKREKRTGAYANYLHGGRWGSWTDQYGPPCFNDAHLFSNEEHDCNKD